MSKLNNAVIVVTGVSTGLGRAFAEAALAEGHQVIGTVRSEEARAAFEALLPGRAHGRILEMTDIDAIAPFASGVQRDFERIDVLVNNAGYGHEGAVEESPLSELRHQMEVNFFGTVALTQAVLPLMRARRKGHILTVTSMGGIVTLPGIAFYHASKFALEGLFESLGKEVRDFGIKVTSIEPGGFRTDWAGRSMVRSERHIEAYDAVMAPIRATRRARHGNQIGDPAKAGQAMLSILGEENPPAHLVLGTDALALVREKLTSLEKELKTWEALSASTDVDRKGP
ncbi:Short-chain dehydrogenase/reductase SDR [Labilithrix luteola]|uniref:Short-chain dehydrogenase/reductase SDR n=1 Tax=Labilithrix luteola TaxID=1391654 RepID=A0A0K1QF31_9BACT|nr:oxidoreductase [Labilithrix luteola]AKV04257.1 Short-chain dehydrogenase/reductase SDR [Labilithrix luteola]